MSPRTTSHIVSCCVVLNEMATAQSRHCVTKAKIAIAIETLRAGAKKPSLLGDSAAWLDGGGAKKPSVLGDSAAWLDGGGAKKPSPLGDSVAWLDDGGVVVIPIPPLSN
jgi:hypothetical protein